MYSEKATKFCEISTNYLTGSTYVGQIISGDLETFCGRLTMGKSVQAAFTVMQEIHQDGFPLLKESHFFKESHL